MSRRGNPASRVVSRRQLRPPALSATARRLLAVVSRLGPIHVVDAASEAGLSERAGFFAASELLERELVEMVPGGLRRSR